MRYREQGARVHAVADKSASLCRLRVVPLDGMVHPDAALPRWRPEVRAAAPRGKCANATRSSRRASAPYGRAQVHDKSGLNVNDFFKLLSHRDLNLCGKRLSLTQALDAFMQVRVRTGGRERARAWHATQEARRAAHRQHWCGRRRASR